MFTMKKFAVLAVAGFFASSMFVACSDDSEDEEEVVGSSSSTTGGGGSVSSTWTEADITGTGFIKKTISVGNLSSNTGSLLDIDGDITQTGGGSPKVYKQTELTGHINDIDLIYEGTNLWTPAGCLASADCSFKSAITGSTSLAQFYNVTSAALSGEANATVTSLATNANSLGSVATYTPHGIYFIQTSVNSYALVLANAEANNLVELIIGYIW